MSATILCYKRLTVLINKRTLIQVRSTSEQTATEMKMFYLQIDDSEHIMNFNHK